MASIFLIKRRVFSILSLTVPRYTNGRASDLNSLQEIIHVSRLSFFTHSLTRSFFVSSLKERNYTYSMYLSTVKVGSKRLTIAGCISRTIGIGPTMGSCVEGAIPLAVVGLNRRTNSFVMCGSSALGHGGTSATAMRYWHFA